MTPPPSPLILLVDADATRHQDLAETLHVAGYRTVEVGSGAAALVQAAELAIVMTRLPDLAGAELCRRFKTSALTAAMPVLLLSDTAPDGAEFVDTGADGFLVCPVHPVELLTLVKALLRHKRAEEALRDNEERFRQMTENIREVFWMADADDKRLLYVSPAYEEIWGRSCQGLYDHPESWRDSIHPDDRARLLAEMAKRGRDGGSNSQFRIVRPDGGVRWIWDRSFPVLNGEGKCYRLVGIAEDITERKRLEEQFRQAQKMEAVGRLAGGVAHDFNNVLTVITGYSDLIMLDSADPASATYRNAEEICKTAEHAAALTRQLLAYSRHQPLAPRVLNLSSVVADMEKMLRRLITEDVALTLHLDAQLRLVEIDPGQVEQVVMNLAVNACDAMPQGGQLTIATTNAELDEAYAWAQIGVQPGAYALLTVTDTGHGMSDEVRAHIYEPFFTTKEIGKGTGLGLATVYGIIKANSGHIEVASEPGQGTSFKIYLPQVMEKLRPDIQRGRPHPVPAGTETILLVEDEEVVRSLARTILQRNGYVVLEASDGPEALAQCERHDGTIHLLVSDVVMPRMSGPELAELVLRLRPQTRVLYMSGYTGFVNEPLAAGAETAFLQKPFTPDALARQVRALLDR